MLVSRTSLECVRKPPVPCVSAGSEPGVSEMGSYDGGSRGFSSGLSFGGLGSSEKRVKLRGPDLSGMCSLASVWGRYRGRFRKLPGDLRAYFPRTRREISPVPRVLHRSDRHLRHGGARAGHVTTYRVGVRVSASCHRDSRAERDDATASPSRTGIRSNVIGLRQSVPGADRLAPGCPAGQATGLRRMRHGMIAAVFEDLALAVRATTSAATRTDKKTVGRICVLARAAHRLPGAGTVGQTVGQNVPVDRPANGA